MVYGCGGRLSSRHRDLFSDSGHHTESRSRSMVDTDLNSSVADRGALLGISRSRNEEAF